MTKTLFVTYVVIGCVITCAAQPGAGKNIQLQQQALQKQLDSLNASLTAIRKATKISTAQLALAERKLAVRQQMINNLNSELANIDNDINAAGLEVIKLQSQLAVLKQDYAASIAFSYKSRSNINYLNFLFAANSFNDALKRIVYLGNYRRDRERIAAGIANTNNELTLKMAKLAASKSGKTDALRQQAVLFARLDEEKREQAAIVQGFKANERSITAQLKQNEKNSIALRKALRLILEREQKVVIARQKQPAPITTATATGNNNKTANVPENAGSNTVGSGRPAVKNYSSLPLTQQQLTQSASFENNRGKLPWPVASGVVSIHYGPYSIENIKGFSEGIYIALPVGAAVKAVADGEVSAVFDLGGESVVTIRHGKYVTSYGNLATTNVSKGDKVHAGTPVGTAATNLTGEGQFQFNIITDKGIFLDPEKWLMQK